MIAWIALAILTHAAALVLGFFLFRYSRRWCSECGTELACPACASKAVRLRANAGGHA